MNCPKHWGNTQSPQLGQGSPQALEGSRTLVPLTHSLVVLSPLEALLLDAGHVEHVRVRQRFLDAPKLLLRRHRKVGRGAQGQRGCGGQPPTLLLTCWMPLEATKLVMSGGMRRPGGVT